MLFLGHWNSHLAELAADFKLSMKGWGVRPISITSNPLTPYRLRSGPRQTLQFAPLCLAVCGRDIPVASPHSFFYSCYLRHSHGQL